MTKYALILPIAVLFSLSGCWWNTQNSNIATQAATEEKAAQEAAEAKVITQITSEQQFATLLKESSKLIAIKVDAPWCSACKDMHPHFVAAANKGSDYVFARINVDTLPSIGQQYDVVGIPTLLFIKNGKEIPNSRIEGAEITSGDELLTKMQTFNTSAEPVAATESTSVTASAA